MKYEELKSIIQQANPEIMELKMGCEVEIINALEYQSEVQWWVVSKTSICKKHKKWREECYSEEDGCEIFDGAVIIGGNDEGYWEEKLNVEKIKSLGRPIRLSDVLLAIYKKSPSNKTRITVESDGQFIRYNPLINQRFAEAWWNLKDDNLDSQSKETKQFLIELLGESTRSTKRVKNNKPDREVR